MPLYEYECEACGKRFEQIRKFADAPLEVCPQCGKGPVHRLMSAPAFQFKGSGWYITDYAKKGSDSSTSDKGGKSETKGETKSETKTETSESTAKTEKSESKPAVDSKPASTPTSSKDS